jgi:hypothetical protein
MASATQHGGQSFFAGQPAAGPATAHPMNFAAVGAPRGIPPMLKQVNRMEYFREYAEYWYIGARTYLLKTLVYLVCGVLVGLVFPLGSLLFFALAGRSHYKVWMFNFVVNNPGRSLVLVK